MPQSTCSAGSTPQPRSASATLLGLLLGSFSVENAREDHGEEKRHAEDDADGLWIEAGRLSSVVLQCLKQLRTVDVAPRSMLKNLQMFWHERKYLHELEERLFVERFKACHRGTGVLNCSSEWWVPIATQRKTSDYGRE